MSIVTNRTITNIEGSAPYLVRWSLWLPFGWSLKLHKIMRADDDRCSHDHPWIFLRFILWGGYTEEFSKADEPTKTIERKPWRLSYCGANFKHRITKLTTTHSWSLVLCGPSVREWGFFTREGWVGWRTFVNMARSARVLWCDDGKELKK